MSSSCKVLYATALPLDDAIWNVLQNNSGVADNWATLQVMRA